MALLRETEDRDREKSTRQPCPQTGEKSKRVGISLVNDIAGKSSTNPSRNSLRSKTCIEPRATLPFTSRESDITNSDFLHPQLNAILIPYSSSAEGTLSEALSATMVFLACGNIVRWPIVCIALGALLSFPILGPTQAADCSTGGISTPNGVLWWSSCIYVHPSRQQLQEVVAGRNGISPLNASRSKQGRG